MKTLIHAYAMCQSMFCVIPCPWKLWDEQAKSKMLLFLPVVGLEIGALWAGLSLLVNLISLPVLVKGVILCSFPYIITGFIHLDGFMDVTDAVMSWRDMAQRREILKDSHVGSFAVICVVMLLMSQLALFASTPTNANNFILILIPAVSRCCSALAVTGLPPMDTSQYAKQKRMRSNMTVLLVMLTVFVSVGFLLCGKYGFVLVGCITGYVLSLMRAYQSLGGMNGDISGYALTIGEHCAIAVYALI